MFPTRSWPPLPAPSGRQPRRGRRTTRSLPCRPHAARQAWELRVSEFRAWPQPPWALHPRPARAPDRVIPPSPPELQRSPPRLQHPRKATPPFRSWRNRIQRWSARPVVRSRSKSPVKVDHLVTFIACEIVTDGGLTEILGTHQVQ